MSRDDRPDPWWRNGVIYQIYVRSFQDSNGDGIGDLPGITSRLDYIHWLGIEAIWLTPFYRSPMQDFGYDVTDHCAVAPEYGTLGDFDRLVRSAHERGIKVVVDFVPNHTSSDHEWFCESRSSRANAKRDWYIWADSKPDGSPPNNWRGQGSRAVDGGAWVFDDVTGQWYLASFSPSQPDLNWSHADVQKAMLDVLDFWFARGVDGVRIDMVDFLGKDRQLRGEAPLPPGADARDYFISARHQRNRPETLDYIRLMRGVADRHDGRVLIGEMFYFLPLDRFATYHGNGELLDLAMNFRLTFAPLEARAIADWVDSYDSALAAAGAWPNYCVGNHDTARVGRHGEATARLVVMLLLTLRGTPFLYYGDEIGLPEVDVPPERQRDRLSADPNNPRSRDGGRTPMQWTDQPNAGFCPAEVEPWLPLAPDWPKRNVAAESTDERSILELTRRLVALRRATPAVQSGDFSLVAGVPDACLAFRRDHLTSGILVVLNFGDLPLEMPEDLRLGGMIIAATGCDRVGERVDRSLRLRAREGIVIDARPQQADDRSSSERLGVILAGPPLRSR